MASAKEVMRALEILDQQRQRLQGEVIQHQRYLFAWYQNNRWIFAVALCSAFLIGWRRPRLLKGVRGFKTLWALLPLMINPIPNRR